LVQELAPSVRHFTRVHEDGNAVLGAQPLGRADVVVCARG
jgi:hypothetical protein